MVVVVVVVVVVDMIAIAKWCLQWLRRVWDM
jgi:hypothetical protein